MAVTLKQIAERAGVSRGTVDRALHDRLDINKEVAERIKRIAKEMGYTPNLAGKLLSDKQYGKRFVGIIISAGGNPFFDDMIRGAETALSEFMDFGVSGEIAVLPPGVAAIDGILAAVDRFVEMGASGIAMTPWLDPRLEAKVQELADAGIPVVTINSDLRGSARLAYVGSPTRKSGLVMAELIAMLADGRSKNLVVFGASDVSLAILRRADGFLTYLRENAPNINVVTVLSNIGDDDDYYRVTREFVAESEDLDYLYILGAGMTGAIRALGEMKKEERPRLFVNDLIDSVKQGLRDGVVQATVTQQPYEQGYLGVQTLIRSVALGQQPEKDIIHTELAVVLSSCL